MLAQRRQVERWIRDKYERRKYARAGANGMPSASDPAHPSMSLQGGYGSAVPLPVPPSQAQPSATCSATQRCAVNDTRKTVGNGMTMSAAPSAAPSAMPSKHETPDLITFDDKEGDFFLPVRALGRNN